MQDVDEQGYNQINLINLVKYFVMVSAQLIFSF